MKLIIVYHSGMMVASRQIFEEFSRHNEVDFVMVLVPQSIKVDKIYNPDGYLQLNRVIKKEKLTIKPINFFKGGGINPLKFFYELFKFRPDNIIVLNEAFSKDVFFTSIAIFLYKSLVLFIKRPKVFFYGFENLNKYKFYSLKQRLVSWWIKKNIHFGAVCTNEAGLILNEAGWYPKTERIWWGVPIDNFKKDFSHEDILKFKKENNINLKHKVIGYIGRFNPEKGLDDLVSAFFNLPIEATLLLVGDGPEKERLNKIIGLFKNNKKNEDKEVVILPAQEFTEIPKIFKVIDVFVLPSKTTNSWKEQYGRVLIEAMASGVSVVGSNSGAIPEVIGKAGLIFHEGDQEELSRVIIKEMREKTKEEINTLKEQAEKGSISNFVINWIKFIKSV